MKKLLLMLLALLPAFGVHAQKLEKGLLWKISGKDITAPSYLFGTMHIACNATLESNVVNAMGKSKQLYLELDMDDPGMAMEMMAGALMKDGKKISDLVSAADYALIDTLLTKKLHMPLVMLNRVKPAFISMMLAETALDCPPESYETNLMNLAHENGTEVYGLESIAEQVAVFDSIPYEEQADELVKVAKDGLTGEREDFKKLMAVYETKDLNTIMAYVNEQDSEIKGHEDVMLKNRNKNWIPKIIGVAKSMPTFFAVGAAHLGGEEGVIMLLRKQGYTVEAVQ